MSDMKTALEALKRKYASNAQERLETRRYLVRVIDARDDWSKFVLDYQTMTGDVLTASKKKANRFSQLRTAIYVRNQLNKQAHVKSAWIVFE